MTIGPRSLWTLCMLAMLFVSAGFTPLRAQNATTVISGMVTDDQGEPLPGAHIVIKGTRTGVTADANGHFSITVPRKTQTVLTLSFIGLETKDLTLKTAGKDNVNTGRIMLTAGENMMADVVVNGYFERNMNTYTGAVTTIKGEDLLRVGNSNVLQSLKTVDPSFLQIENLGMGSNPNALPDFQLRGSSTISSVQGEYSSSANQPLFILDGFETELTKIMDLNMDQVLSVTTLKDATAKAIYGAKAANGVIVIETKRPESGRLRVTYTGALDIEAPDLSSYDLCNAAEKLEVERMAGLFTSKNGSAVNQISLDQAYNSKLREILAGVNTDWMAQPTRVGVGHKHSLYVEGGDQAMLYGVNLSYNNIEGVMKGSDRNTFSGGITLSYRVKDFIFRNKLTIDYNDANESPYGTFDQYCALNPYSRLYNSNGLYPQSYSYTGIDGLAKPIGNPLYNTTMNTINNSTYTNITNNFYAEWQAAERLKVTGRFGFVNKKTTQDIFRPANHTDFIGVSDVLQKGSYYQSNGNHTDVSGDLGLNYSIEAGKNLIFLNGTLSMNSNRYNNVGINAQGFTNDFMDDIKFAVAYAKDAKPTGTEGISRSVSGLLSVNYSFDEKYLLDGNVRYSGSSEAGRDNRWNTFWSAGAGWNIHKEGFLKEASWLNRLKVRASYGYTGSQGFSSYDALTTFGYFTDQTYNGAVGSFLQGLANAGLNWQEKYDLNVGLDFAMFNNRLTGRLDYYKANTKGMITNVNVPFTTGFSTYVANLGESQNEGVEAYINGRVYSGKHGRDYVNIFGSLAHNKNTLKKISNSLRAWNDKQDASMLENGTVTPSVKYYEGCSMNAIWAVKSLGIDPQNGKEIFVKRDGTITYDYDIADQVVCGDKQPKFNGIIGFNGEINGWGFNVSGSFRWGGQIYNTTLVDKVENAPIESNVDRRVFTDRWQKPGDIALYKSIADQSITYPTSRFVEDYNIFTLSSLSVYYDFRNCKFVKDSFLERLKVTAYTTDLFIISSVKTERGTQYPYARTFSLSAQLTF